MNQKREKFDPREPGGEKGARKSQKSCPPPLVICPKRSQKSKIHSKKRLTKADGIEVEEINYDSKIYLVETITNKIFSEECKHIGNWINNKPYIFSKIPNLMDIDTPIDELNLLNITCPPIKPIKYILKTY